MGDRAFAAAIVFDLDGTLIDSRADLASAVNALRAGRSLPPADLATVGSWIGEGARRLVERALDGSGAVTTADLGRFLELYESHSTEQTRPYAGIEELLSELARRKPLALLTNKPERPTRLLVDHFGWSHYFDPVVAGDSLPYRKPDPRTLREIAQRLDRPVESLLLVGDSEVDAATARAAGAGFCWVEWGYARPAERETLERGPCAADVETLRALLLTA